MNGSESCPSQIIALLEQLDVEFPGKYPLIITFLILNVVLTFSATLENGFLITTILRSPNLQTPSYLLITSLAFTDLLVGLLWHPLQVVFISYHLQNNIKDLCAIISTYVFVITLVAGLSVMMITSISVDRFLALTLRHRYRVLVTRNRIRLSIVGVWVSGFAWAFSLQTNTWDGKDTILRIFFPFLVILLGISCTFYIKAFRTLHIYTRQVRSQNPNHLHSSGDNFDVARYKKTLKTMLFVLGSLLLTYVPTICSLLVRIALGFRREMIYLYFVSLTLWGLDSSTNPVVYFVRFQDIRQASKETFRDFIQPCTQKARQFFRLFKS